MWKPDWCQGWKSMFEALEMMEKTYDCKNTIIVCPWGEKESNVDTLLLGIAIIALRRLAAAEELTRDCDE
ncbi:unnamed protein product [Bursaphelenchus xylophilus]|uniref:(pine wood nematode) hypothetical protein n=1 Tax=Bursaphelenchus xylophilus TaxID=6326 RepID=A0A7I8XCC5_BURXY|nr:unnamed protein product [Bursaphelenchus xylophilus]CAG9131553.1 unnamed protein product [Bursaphelenchus xylophilus]